MIAIFDPSDLQPYLHDASNMSGGSAVSVVIPDNENEVATALAAASKANTPVTIAGAGTGIVGGRIPFGGIVLSTERLNAIRCIDADHGIAGAGVILNDYVMAAKQNGLLYAPDPTEWSCFLGGTVATNASGARTFKYGATRNHICRLRIALSTGDLLDLRRDKFFAEPDGTFTLPLESGRTLAGKLPGYHMPQTRKNASGYYIAPGMDLIDLFIGSEGTLGIVTEVETRLLPLPQDQLSCVVFFESQYDLLTFVTEARDLSFASRRSQTVNTIDATALEYFDSESLGLMRENNPSIPLQAAGAILFEQEMTPETENNLLSAWMELFETNRAMLDDSWFATNETDRARLRDFRHALPVKVNEWLTHHRQRKVSTDMAVPDDRFPAMLDFYQQELKSAHLQYVIFGHIGDSHVHVNILPRNDDEATLARAIYGRFVERAVSVGGTVSAEHGIGKLKKDYLKVLYGESLLKEMAALKRVFDPACVLGRGTMFSESYL